MTTTKTTNDRAYVVTKVIDSDDFLQFTITQASIDEATCGDPSKCVVARGLSESVAKFSVLMVSNKLESVVVGPIITKILLTGGVVIRFSTPENLMMSLKHFDLTGQWDLPVGDYALRPLAQSLRSDYVRVSKKTGLPEKNTNKATKTGARMRPLPTRFVPRICAPKTCKPKKAN